MILPNSEAQWPTDAPEQYALYRELATRGPSLIPSNVRKVGIPKAAFGSVAPDWYFPTPFDPEYGITTISSTEPEYVDSTALFTNAQAEGFLYPCSSDFGFTLSDGTYNLDTRSSAFLGFSQPIRYHPMMTIPMQVEMTTKTGLVKRQRPWAGRGIHPTGSWPTFFSLSSDVSTAEDGTPGAGPPILCLGLFKQVGTRYKHIRNHLANLAEGVPGRWVGIYPSIPARTARASALLRISKLAIEPTTVSITPWGTYFYTAMEVVVNQNAQMYGLSPTHVVVGAFPDVGASDFSS